MAHILHTTVRIGLVIALVLSLLVACDPPTKLVEQPKGAPSQTALTGYEGSLIMHWGTPDEDADAVTGYEVRYRRLESWTGGPAEAWKHSQPTLGTQLRIDVPTGSYEAQVRAHRGESASAWWPVPPSKDLREVEGSADHSDVVGVLLRMVDVVADAREMRRLPASGHSQAV
ncbi:MAG: fibronectin type III domain-containing protein [Spirochaetaceae bacterium]|nr:fibronectin type III domain-containing protein [Spirochaetaceae bacterium]